GYSRGTGAGEGREGGNIVAAREGGVGPVGKCPATALDLVDMQVAASAEDLQPAGGIGVSKPYCPVARGGAGAIRREVAEGGVGEAKVHACDRADRGASGRLVGPGIDLPGQATRGQGEAATPEVHRGDGSDACTGHSGT